MLEPLTHSFPDPETYSLTSQGRVLKVRLLKAFTLLQVDLTTKSNVDGTDILRLHVVENRRYSLS